MTLEFSLGDRRINPISNPIAQDQLDSELNSALPSDTVRFKPGRKFKWTSLEDIRIYRAQRRAESTRVSRLSPEELSRLSRTFFFDKSPNNLHLKKRLKGVLEKTPPAALRSSLRSGETVSLKPVLRQNITSLQAELDEQGQLNLALMATHKLMKDDAMTLPTFSSRQLKVVSAVSNNDINEIFRHDDAHHTALAKELILESHFSDSGALSDAEIVVLLRDATRNSSSDVYDALVSNMGAVCRVMENQEITALHKSKLIDGLEAMRIIFAFDEFQPLVEPLLAKGHRDFVVQDLFPRLRSGAMQEIIVQDIITSPYQWTVPNLEEVMSRPLSLTQRAQRRDVVVSSLEDRSIRDRPTKGVEAFVKQGPQLPKILYSGLQDMSRQ